MYMMHRPMACLQSGAHNERGWENSVGKERETPTHLMKPGKLSCWPAVTIFSSLKHGRLYYLVYYHAMHAFTVKERTGKALSARK